MFSVVIVVALCLLASVAHSSPDSEPFDKSVCSLPPEVGICNASIRKYYYDHSSKTCKEFIYGGCRGNGNRFDTIEECQATCSGV